MSRAAYFFAAPNDEVAASTIRGTGTSRASGQSMSSTRPKPSLQVSGTGRISERCGVPGGRPGRMVRSKRVRSKPTRSVLQSSGYSREGEDDLADLAAVGEVLVSQSCLLQRVGGGDGDPKASGGQQRQDVAFDLPGEQGLLFQWPAAQR